MITDAHVWATGPKVLAHCGVRGYGVSTVMCRVDGYDGELVRVTDESVDAGWFDPGALPEGSGGLVTRALRDLTEFETKGTFALD